MQIDFVKHIVVLFVLFLAVDSVYLYFISSSFAKMIQHIQGSPLQIKLVGGIVCYLALAILLYYFIVLPRRSPMEAALLGAGTYAVYESTSYALMTGWDWRIATIDTVWGGALFYSVAYLSRFFI